MELKAENMLWSYLLARRLKQHNVDKGLVPDPAIAFRVSTISKSMQIFPLWLSIEDKEKKNYKICWGFANKIFIKPVWLTINLKRKKQK